MMKPLLLIRVVRDQIPSILHVAVDYFERGGVGLEIAVGAGDDEAEGEADPEEV